MKYKNIREEELKNKVGADWFKSFDTTEILGNVDFTVFPKQDSIFGRIPLLWAEAKTGNFDVPTIPSDFTIILAAKRSSLISTYTIYLNNLFKMSVYLSAKPSLATIAIPLA